MDDNETGLQEPDNLDLVTDSSSAPPAVPPPAYSQKIHKEQQAQLAPGQKKIKELRDSGATEDQVKAWTSQAAEDFQKGGYTADQIKQYFGVKEPDMSAVHKHVTPNFIANGYKPPPPGQPVEAKDVWEALKAGFEGSDTGLFFAKHMPTTVLGENAGPLEQVAFAGAQMLGDLPAMLIGGAAMTGTGPIGMAAGAFAAPAAIRKLLTDEYTKGHIQDSADFTQRLVSATWEAAKGGITGAATAAVGATVGTIGVMGVIGKSALMEAVGGTAGVVASEVAAMTTVSKALEGELPNKRDFINGAIAIGGLHAVGAAVGNVGKVGKIPEKLINIYRSTGLRPEQVVAAAQNDPVILGELASEDPHMPKEAAPPPTPKDSKNTYIDPETGEKMFFDPNQSTGNQFAKYTVDDLKKFVAHNEERLKDPDLKPLLREAYEENNKLWKEEIAKIESGKGGDVVEGNFGGKPKPGDVVTPDGKVAPDIGPAPEGTLEDRKRYVEENEEILKDPNLNPKVRKILEQINKIWKERIAKVESGEGAEVIEGKFGKTEAPAETESKDLVPVRGEGGGSGGDGGGGNLPMVPVPEGGEPPSGKTSSSMKELNDRVGEDPEAKKLTGWEKIKDGFSKLYANHVDYTAAIGTVLKKIGADKLLGKENAQHLMRLHSAIMDKFNEFVGWDDKDNFEKSGTRDFHTGEKNGESLRKILFDYVKATGDKALDGLRAYGIAARTIELAGRGIKQKGFGKAFDLNESADRQFLLENQHIQEYFNRMVDYQNRVLDYLGASGRYSEESIAAMKKMNSRFIPFKKIFEPDPITGQLPFNSRAIKEIGDSDRFLRDPITEMFKNTETMVRLAHEVEATNTFIGAMLKKPELGKIGNRPLLETTIVPEGQPKAEFPEENQFIRVSENQAGRAGKHQIEGWENGKRTLYDTLPEVAESIKAMAGNRPAMTVWTALLKPFATGLRLGTVDNPLFGLRHTWRQQITAPTLSKTGLKTFEALKYTMEYLSNSDLVHQFLFDGGAVSEIMPRMKDWVEENIYDIDGKAPFLKKVWNGVNTAVEFSHTAIALHDNIIRFAEYKRSLEKGMSRTEAAYNAREVLPDFQRAGLQMSAWKQITAFLNVHVQGVARSGEELYSSPLGFVAKNLAYITVPSVLLSWAQSGDDVINDLPDWQRFNYWAIHIPNWRPANSLAEAMQMKAAYPSNVRQGPDGQYHVNDGTVVRLQKPFSTGIFFGSIFDTARNPKEFGKFMAEVGDSVLMNPVATALQPAFEQFMNKNVYTGSPLVRQSMEGKLPEMQYDRYTSETAKALGKLISYVPYARDIGPKNAKLASPKVIENYIHGWGGTLGFYAVDVIDKGLRAAGVAPKDVSPTSTLADIPFVREFVIRFPNAHPQSVSDFEERYQKANEVFNSVRQLMKEGDARGARQLQDRYSINMGRLVNVDKAIKNLNTAIQRTNQLDIDPTQKRQLIDGMMLELTSIAKQGNMVMDEFENNAKTRAAGSN